MGHPASRPRNRSLLVEGLGELGAEPELVGKVLHEHVRVLVKVGGDLFEVELADPLVDEDVEIAEGVRVVVGVCDLKTEEVDDVARDRPVVARHGVVEDHLHVATTYPHDHEELAGDGDQAGGPGITRQAAQLLDQVVQVIGQDAVESCGDRLTVLAIEGDDEINVLIGCVFVVVVIVVVIGIVVIVVVIGHDAAIQILVVIETLVRQVVDLGHDAGLDDVSIVLATLKRAHNALLNLGLHRVRQGRLLHPRERHRRLAGDRSPATNWGAGIPGTATHPCPRVWESGSVQIIVADHPLVSHKVTLLRDRRTPSPTFRQLVDELVTLLAYEATREVRVETVEVQTPLTTTTGVTIGAPKPLVVPILRAGLGMLDGMLRLLPTAEVGFVGMARNEETLEPVTYAERLPQDLSGRQCFVLDPMLATGGSLGGCLQFLAKRGVRDVTCVCLFAAPEGIKRFSDEVEQLGIQCKLVVAVVDDHLDEHGYIVPGLGDAGDRLYGLVD